MQTLRKVVVWCVFVAGLAVVIAFAMPTYRQGEASLAGKPERDFLLRLDGKQTRLSDLRGKVVVLNFWASWCPPCVSETPSLNTLQKYVAPRGGIVLGVSIDDDPAAYQKFLKDQGVNFPTWRDPSAVDRTSPVAASYGTSMIPETYVIDRQGRIARKIVGPQQWDSQEMLAYFDAMLGQS
jgi:peroxiredoxin